MTATSIGRYEIIRPLGQGGMGRVMLARDTVLGRQVAIKVLRDDLALPAEQREALFARMRQEARAAAAVIHPHLVILHDMGEDEAHGLYLVFEFVPGVTLRERIAQGSIEIDEVLEVAKGIASALDRAHRAGIIHRDVKPENVMFSETNAAKLTDFGIARVPDSKLTRAGAVLGTAAYSAPEALALGEFSPRSDQFSFAAMLYEAIAGRRPFEGEDALAIAHKIALDDPPVLRRASDGTTMQRAHAVLARGMAKDPKARFATCTELADALASAISGANLASIRTPPPSEAPRSFTLPPQARRAQNIALAAAILTIVGLLVFGRRAPTPPAADADDAGAPIPIHRIQPPVHKPKPDAAAPAAPTATATASAEASD